MLGRNCGLTGMAAPMLILHSRVWVHRRQFGRPTSDFVEDPQTVQRSGITDERQKLVQDIDWLGEVIANMEIGAARCSSSSSIFMPGNRDDDRLDPPSSAWARARSRRVRLVLAPEILAARRWRFALREGNCSRRTASIPGDLQRATAPLGFPRGNFTIGGEEGCRRTATR